MFAAIVMQEKEHLERHNFSCYLNFPNPSKCHSSTKVIYNDIGKQLIQNQTYSVISNIFQT